jgi:hypothetical protein
VGVRVAVCSTSLDACMAATGVLGWLGKPLLQRSAAADATGGGGAQAGGWVRHGVFIACMMVGRAAGAAGGGVDAGGRCAAAWLLALVVECRGCGVLGLHGYVLHVLGGCV